MDPKKGITLRDVQVGTKQVSADSPVWILADATGRSDVVEVEYKGQRGFVPRESVAFSPVPAASLVALRELDACFGGAPELFETEQQDDARYFSVRRCKAHGRRFLHDMQGGIAMYERITLLDADDSATPEDVWAKYHGRSTDFLSSLGRTR